MAIFKDEFSWIYEKMYKIAEVNMKGKSPVFNIDAGPIPGEIHLAIG